MDSSWTEASTELANIVARHRLRNEGRATHASPRVTAASLERIFEGAEKLDAGFRQRFFHPVLLALQKCIGLSAQRQLMPLQQQRAL